VENCLCFVVMTNGLAFDFAWARDTVNRELTRFDLNSFPALTAVTCTGKRILHASHLRHEMEIKLQQDQSGSSSSSVFIPASTDQTDLCSVWATEVLFRWRKGWPTIPVTYTNNLS